MTFVRIGKKLYPATISGRKNDYEWDGRESKAITLNIAHSEAAGLFVDDAEWSIVYQDDSYIGDNGKTVMPEPEEYDNSEFCIAGSITDHRDGTVTVVMGKLTKAEEKEVELAETEAALDEAYEIIYGGV